MNCRLALEKDPGYVRALLLMGQILLQKEEHAEATEFLESSISKVLIFMTSCRFFWSNKHWIDYLRLLWWTFVPILKSIKNLKMPPYPLEPHRFIFVSHDSRSYETQFKILLTLV